MEDNIINIRFSELEPVIQKLLIESKRASHMAYAPYSKFYVGAAVLTDKGEIFTGQNQENASFPACMCGERVALYNYCANTTEVITALGIFAVNKGNKTSSCVAPCGVCRQVILEYRYRQKQAFPIYSMNQNDIVQKWNSIDQLIPEGFLGSHLI